MEILGKLEEKYYLTIENNKIVPYIKKENVYLPVEHKLINIINDIMSEYGMIEEKYSGFNTTDLKDVIRFLTYRLRFYDRVFFTPVKPKDKFRYLVSIGFKPN